jgi:subtilisin family serine protease
MQISIGLLALSVFLSVGWQLIICAKSKPAIDVRLERLLCNAENNEFLDVIITMQSKLSSDSFTDRSRSEVVELLRQHATACQADLLAQLNQYGRDQVANVERLWLGNRVFVSATGEVIKAVAARSDVSLVRPNTRITGLLAFECAWPAIEPTWDHQNITGLDEVRRRFGCYGKGVKVAVLDAGVDITHPDLAGKMYTTNPADATYPGGWAEFRYNGGLVWGSTPHDSSGHGTAVASIIVGGNTSGFDIGVAPEARFMAGKVLNQTGVGRWDGFPNQIGAGIQWAVENGADIIVLSFEKGHAGFLYDDLEDDYAAAKNAGVIIIGVVSENWNALSRHGLPNVCYTRRVLKTIHLQLLLATSAGRVSNQQSQVSSPVIKVPRTPE